jgi:hypothetical protein
MGEGLKVSSGELKKLTTLLLFRPLATKAPARRAKGSGTPVRGLASKGSPIEGGVSWLMGGTFSLGPETTQPVKVKARSVIIGSIKLNLILGSIIKIKASIYLW